MEYILYVNLYLSSHKFIIYSLSFLVLFWNTGFIVNILVYKTCTEHCPFISIYIPFSSRIVFHRILSFLFIWPWGLYYNYIIYRFSVWFCNKLISCTLYTSWHIHARCSAIKLLWNIQCYIVEKIKSVYLLYILKRYVFEVNLKKKRLL